MHLDAKNTSLFLIIGSLKAAFGYLALDQGKGRGERKMYSFSKGVVFFTLLPLYSG